MKIYDISQEVFSCVVFPGDPKPERQVLCATESGALYNLTAFSMCSHNGTHVDAPFHFLGDGKTVDQMCLSIFVGECFVARHEGNVTQADAKGILKKAEGVERILIAGNVTVTAEAAEVFAGSGVKLLGNEGPWGRKTRPCRCIRSSWVGELRFWKALCLKMFRRDTISSALRR